MRSLSLLARVACAILAVVVAGCGSSGTPVAPNSAAAAAKPCPDKIGFSAGYLPAGFSNQLQPGPASGLPSLTNVTIYHYTGGGGSYIEFLRGGRRSALNGSVGMIVLSHLARIGPIPHGYAINFRLAGQRCAVFQVVGVGLPSAEVVKIGHGLKPAAG